MINADINQVPIEYEIGSIFGRECPPRHPWEPVVAMESHPWKIGNVIFTHVPKTGGTWLTRTLKKERMWDAVGDGHFPRRYLPEEFSRGCVVVAGTRHPLTWLRSWWTYHLKEVSKIKGKLARLAATFDALESKFTPEQVRELEWRGFDFGSFYHEDWWVFLDRVVKYRPDAWSCMMEFFTATTDVTEMETIVVHQENLKEDFAAVVDVYCPDRPELAGRIRKLGGRLNVTEDPHTDFHRIFPKGVMGAIKAANIDYIRRYGYETEIWG